MNSLRLSAAGRVATPAWRSAPGWLLGSVMLAMLVFGAEPTAASSQVPETPSPAAELTIPEAPQEAAPERPGSAGWGMITDVQYVEAQGDVPASYTLTVRLRDGSLRTSNGRDGSRWQVGERILLIG